MHSESGVFEQIVPQRDFSFHSLSTILTFILLPHFWCFSIPALIFSKESKKLYYKGNTELSKYFSQKAAKFVVSSWALTIFILAVLVLFYLAITTYTI